MRRPVRSRWPFARALSLLLVAALACSGGRASAAPVPPAPTNAPVVAPRIRRVADANTAAILLTSHNAVLASARIAATRARNRDVKLLSRNLVTDHAAMSTTLSKLLGSIDVTPREDDISRLLRDQSAARRDTLRDLTGWPFDSAYVESEVRFHQDLLVAIDRVFIPSVRNQRLKDSVTTLRPAISAHLALAEQVRDAIAAAR